MEETKRVDGLYNILYTVLDDVCAEILCDGREEEETDEELTVENILEVIEGELEEESENYNYGEDFESFEDFDAEEEIEKKEASQTEALFYFLTHADEKYDKIFAKVAEQMEYPFIQDFILYKYILILIVTSVTYCNLLYDEKRGIIEIDEDLRDVYDNIIDDPQSVYRLFYDRQNQDKAKKIVDIFLDYFASEKYIRNTIMLEILIKDKKLSKLLKINPFECLSWMFIYGINEVTASEIAIQNFVDAYDAVLNCAYEEELDDEDRKALFLEKIDEYYEHDKTAIDKALCYIFSNVYENLHFETIEGHDCALAEVIQDNADSLADFIEAFKNDVNFFWTLMDNFYSFNNFLQPDDLAFLRWNFKTGNGNMKVLKKLNPFYEQEEKMFDTAGFSIDE